MLKTIKFSKNWNGKLDNEIFTTIRKKECGIIHGDKAAIVLIDRVYKWVQCVGFTSCKFAELSPVLLAIDTGIADLSVHNVFKQCGINSVDTDCEIDFLLLKSIPRPHEFINPETAINLKLFQE